ncbi:DUF4175 family protein [Polaribacter sargassicola]|uniref:DUF4175 family protein n=1 Tax=Polaribacter sargassicola TaxID=2836891 RepID=UPI001F360736|nr:DUF4175 family protein [Polaribacter sp. DS7-9]MCG1035079.1 DUF4175 family protein [Polaribacter sp. DS7-9]
MAEFKQIEEKLHQFTRKYYTSELIKGSILFFSFGLLYLLFTLFLEYFLWLKPYARTILFWLFLLVELFLLIRFIFVPIFKLVGLRKGISFEECSKIIGNHFPQVQDKLLNILQLQKSLEKSDLLIASINQKSQELVPVPFVKAVDFKKNKKYLKYIIIPILIFIINSLSGNNGKLTQSLQRVVNHNITYNPPAPFNFILKNTDLKVIQGKSISILFETNGKVLPKEAYIHFNNEKYLLENNDLGSFSYLFSDVQQPINFYIEANGIQSQNYTVDVVKTPTINNISLELNYPKYLNKKNEVIENSGNISVPEGTVITWQVTTNQTESLSFLNNDKRKYFDIVTNNVFKYSQKIYNSLDYQISSSNNNLKDFENLNFSIDVIKDEFPTISVSSNFDETKRGTSEFAGQISDDYGLNKLEIIYYDDNNSENKHSINLDISKENIQTFFYQFPDGLNLIEGINYEFFFQISDNDAVNGFKKSKSKVFNFKKRSREEVEEELLKEQKNAINNIESTVKEQKKQQKYLDEVKKDLQTKKNISWNDKNKIENFVKRQQDYNQMMNKQSEKLQDNLEEINDENEALKNKKEELKKRIEELKKNERQKKLLDEIEKMAEKLNKEDLVKKAKELSEQNKQQERSLERILELTKRFYVEQKTMQIANKIQNLSEKQKELINKTENSLENQKQINQNFKAIKKEIKDLNKDNEKLKEPLGLPDLDEEQNNIDKDLEKSEENLSKDNKASAKKNQKNASQKMKNMSSKIQQSMLKMEAESIEENIDDLRKILENLLNFSFKQELLMHKFEDISTTHPDFGNDLKKQNDLKVYFEHIDDSLYVLSMRVPKISSKIKEDLSSTHYNLDQSLDNFSENYFDHGISNQRYVMNSVNSLSDYLSNILNNMQNSMSLKRGDKNKNNSKEFSLPDLIKKQNKISDDLKKGSQKGNKPDDKEGGEKEGNKGKNSTNGNSGSNGKNGKEGNSDIPSSEELDSEIYKIYKQQSILRQELQNQIENNSGINPDFKNVLKSMEELENDILEKGFNTEVLNNIEKLNYQLLKLENANLEQGEDKNRNSKVSLDVQKKRNIKAIEFKKQFYNQTEILNRQSLPLQQNYKIKVRDYFSNIKED